MINLLTINTKIKLALASNQATNLRRIKQRPERAAPSKRTVVPPSGIAPVAAWNENVGPVPVPGSDVVNVQVPGVALKPAEPAPLATIVPVPTTDTVPAPCEKIDEAIRLNVNVVPLMLDT